MGAIRSAAAADALTSAKANAEAASAVHDSILACAEALLASGKNGDAVSEDGIFSAQIKSKSKKIEYYIYAENEEAAMFSPERAER